MADQPPDPIEVLLSTTINWNPLDRSAGRDDPHKEHNYSGSCALCRMDRPESLPAIFAALTEAGFELRPVVDDATREEVEALIESLRSVARLVERATSNGRARGPETYARAAELLAAAYLGRTDK